MVVFIGKVEEPLPPSPLSLGGVGDKEAVIPPVGFKFVEALHYPKAFEYEGWAERALVSFKVPSPIPDKWVVKIGTAIQEKVRLHRGELLKVAFWKREGVLEEWRMEAVATASPLPWGIIIPMALAVLGIVALSFLVLSVERFWHKVIKPIFPEPLLPVVGIGGLVLLGFLIWTLARKE